MKDVFSSKGKKHAALRNLNAFRRYLKGESIGELEKQLGSMFGMAYISVVRMLKLKMRETHSKLTKDELLFFSSNANIYDETTWRNCSELLLTATDRELIEKPFLKFSLLTLDDNVDSMNLCLLTKHLVYIKFRPLCENKPVKIRELAEALEKGMTSNFMFTKKRKDSIKRALNSHGII